MSALPVTTLLNQALAGDTSAAERVWSEVYAEVRTIAAGALTRESSTNAAAADLDPTGLVHEVFLRIGRNFFRAWDDRRHSRGALRRTA